MFRYLPCRHPTGLIAVGRPGRDAAVFVSGNYFHSVRQVLKCLRGLDCYLLVADSAGINIWCAAGAGDFTEHKIADAVNTYRLADAVDHKDIILPQLSAVGIDKAGLLDECGFRARWGPADYHDIRAYVRNGLECTDDMRRVRMSVANRLCVAAGMLSSYAIFAVVLWAMSRVLPGVDPATLLVTISVLLAVVIFTAAFSDRMPLKWPTTNILLVGLLICVLIGALGAGRVVRASTA